jgi:hypothetical protein
MYKRMVKALLILGFMTSSLFTQCSDAEPPEVQITDPLDGSTISGTVDIVVEVTTDEHIEYVEIFIDDVLEFTTVAEPYVYPWQTASFEHNSIHTIFAKGYDEYGREGISDTITVTVSILGVLFQHMWEKLVKI